MDTCKSCVEHLNEIVRVRALAVKYLKLWAGDPTSSTPDEIERRRREIMGESQEKPTPDTHAKRGRGV